MNVADSSTAPGSNRRPRRLTPRRVALLLASPFLVAAVFIFWAHRQSLRVVAHWPQDSAVQYDTGGPYHFLVVESDRDWRGFPFSFGRHYFLLVGREISGDQSGYRVDYSFHPATAGVEAYLAKCSVEWTPPGLWFHEPSGQRLFIPKEAFAEGR
jgi:hypothetical protein